MALQFASKLNCKYEEDQNKRVLVKRVWNYELQYCAKFCTKILHNMCYITVETIELLVLLARRARRKFWWHQSVECGTRYLPLLAMDTGYYWVAI